MNLCKHGCGREGIKQNKDGSWICSENPMGCPEVRRKHLEAQKKRETKVEVVCAWCAKTKKVMMKDYKRNQRFFCTNNDFPDSCRAQWQSVFRTGPANPAWEGGMVDVKCLNCGKPLKRKKCREKGNHFCTDKNCYGEWQSKNMVGSNHHAYKGGGVVVTCAWCGREKTIPIAWTRSKTYFCGGDRECESKWKQVNMAGENSPTWKGGISYEPYCAVWKDADFKEYIKERDDNKCQNPDCWHTTDNRTLHIHHIDFVKKNCHPDNLITLCCSCNARANTDREWHTKYYQELLCRQGKLLQKQAA